MTRLGSTVPAERVPWHGINLAPGHTFALRVVCARAVLVQPDPAPPRAALRCVMRRVETPRRGANP
ncbi:hypothetical protein ACU19_06300 [Actinobaculum suis]|nr:hypothetical protein ACU19_06300 [Actinobaculum suis]